MGAPIRLRVNRGQVFGRLTVLDPEVRLSADSGNTQGRRAVHCQCSCGNETLVGIRNLVSGMTKSCGCGKTEGIRAGNSTHGLVGHPLYKTWLNIRQRCQNPGNKAYMYYGGRGIRLHESWADPRNFVAWIEEHLGPRPEGFTLDRIDNDGNYEPGNVRWATWQEQLANRREMSDMQLRLLMAGSNNWPAMVG